MISSTQPSVGGSLRRRRIRKRWIAAAVAVLLVTGVGVAVAATRTSVKPVAAVDTTLLAAGTIQDSISATGVVASANTFKVYTTLTYSVRTVDVSVGDVVRQGDKLCDLDTSMIQKQIDGKEASINQAKATSDAAIRAARDKYNAAVTAVNKGTNPTLVNAESAVTTAYDAWTKAQKGYDDYAATLTNDQNSQVLAQKAAMDNAANALNTAQYNYDKAASDWLIAQTALEADPTNPDLQKAFNVADDVKTRAELALQSATSVYENAMDSYFAAVNSADNTLADLALAVKSSYHSYQNALAAMDAARANAQTEIRLNLDSLRSAQASASNAAAIQDLVNLNRDLASTIIRAPMSGTVTAVYANVGANPAGVIFVIEQTDQLVIDASVKEYDVATVYPGIPVTIQSDATRDAVFEGRLVSVAPASDKDATGKTITGSDVQYATKVKVLNTGTPLRIGMNVRLNYVIAEQAGALVVPFDAVYTNASGAQAVLAAVPRADGKYTLEELPVATGLENDLNVSISGSGIVEGLRILNTPAKYKAGSLITITG